MRRVLVATDWSEGAGFAVNRAARLAGEQDAALLILHVVPVSASESEIAAARARLRDLVNVVASENPDIPCVSSNVQPGKPAETILAKAAADEAGLIVIGRHAHSSWFEELFGSTGERILRRMGVPILVVHDAPQGPYRKLLVAVDTDRATDELQLACSLSSAQSIYAVHAFHAPFEAFLPGDDVRAYVRAEDMRKLQHEVQQVLGGVGRTSLAVYPMLEEGEVLPVLAKVADELQPDLVVIGTHGRSGLSLALNGSWAGTILKTLAFDILVGRARERPAASG